MRSRTFIALFLLVGFGSGLLFWIAARLHAGPERSAGIYLPKWEATRAAAYLDQREMWWQSWAPAQKDHGTICISCHTSVPYAMARPALRQALDQTAMVTPEKVLVDSVEKRVAGWGRMAPFYSEQDGRDKAAQSRATEAVLNAVILGSYDARQGHLRPITKTAFDQAWALQEREGENAGSWKWQDFSLAPWESTESGYQGAAMFAVQVLNVPDGLAADPAAEPYLNRLREYLKREYLPQPLMNQLYILWASAKSPGLITSTQQQALLAALQKLEQPDGGWALSSLDPGNQQRDSRWRWIRKRLNITPGTPQSDGCATGLIVLVLEEIGTSRKNPMLLHGLQWLESHQELDGSWRAGSLNARRDPRTDVGRFMTDAATGYAVMALEEFRQQSGDPARLATGVDLTSAPRED